MAYLYSIHEEGKGNSPKRPTLRPAMKKKRPYRGIARDVVRGSVNGNYRSALRQGGEQLAREVKKNVIKLKTPPLKPSTLRNRSGSNPLVDTGQFIRSIGSKVE